jgi:H+/Cl- antiporter ClcA
LLIWALLAGPVIGVFAALYIRVIGWVSYHRASGAKVMVAMPVAFAILAVIALKYPQLYGNGKGMAHDAFLGLGGLSLLAVLSLLKPLVTALCLGSGASGGLFTPVMSTGAVMGGFLGLAWSLLWPGSPPGAYAMIGAAAMIGAGMQAPLAALVLVLELTHEGFALMVPMVIATVIATAVTRWIDGYSIYSARLSAPDSQAAHQPGQLGHLPQRPSGQSVTGHN